MKKLILILTIALSSSFAFAGEPALDLTEGEPVLTQPTGVPGSILPPETCTTASGLPGIIVPAPLPMPTGVPSVPVTEGEPVLPTGVPGTILPNPSICIEAPQPTGVPGLPDPSSLPAYRLFRPATSIAFSTKSLCPEEALRCTVTGTSVEVAYQVDCDQQLVNFNYETITVGDEIHLFTSATLAENPRPANSARCLGTSVQRKTINLRFQYGEVVLHELGKIEDPAE